MITDLFYPLRCPFCGRKIQKKRFSEEGYCEECKYNGCVIRGHDSFPNDALPNVLELFCPFVYAGEVKSAVVKYKFNGETWLSIPFANALYSHLSAFGEFESAEIITYVPISDERFAKRGYDQSELIAREIASKSGIPLVRIISRRSSENAGKARSDASDAGITSKKNLTERMTSERFTINEQADISSVSGKRVLIIDDILTTGSTLCECAALILSLNACAVDAAVIASGRRDVRNIGVFEKEGA